MITLNDICKWDSVHGGKRGDKIVSLLKKLVFASKSKVRLQKTPRVEGMPAESFLQDIPLNKCKQYLRTLALVVPGPSPSPYEAAASSETVEADNGPKSTIGDVRVSEVEAIVGDIRSYVLSIGAFDGGPNMPKTPEELHQMLENALVSRGVSSTYQRAIIIGTFLGLASGNAGTVK